jgi:predicted aspartyl protease
MLRLNGAVFAASYSRYLDKSPDSVEPTAKIYVTVEFPGLENHSLAQLDTGAAWSVLERDVAEELGLYEGDGERVEMLAHTGPVSGRLERVPLKLVAEEGESLEIEATFLVSRNWRGKTFLGYTGFLDRVRIALDPGSNLFYFGESE